MNLWQLLTSRCAGDILWELREECGLEQAELLQGAALLRALQNMRREGCLSPFR